MIPRVERYIFTLIILSISCYWSVIESVYQITSRNTSSLSESFNTTGIYNIRLIFTSEGEGLIEIIKEPLLPKERPIYVKCYDKTFVLMDWFNYKFNNINNYRKSLGLFPQREELQCTIGINTVFRQFVARKNQRQKAFSSEPIIEDFIITPITVGDTLNGAYEWTDEPLFEDSNCLRDLVEISRHPPVPTNYKQAVNEWLNDRKIFISLTTTPGRLMKLHYTLRSLVLDRVEKIFITLPKKYKNKDKYKIPNKLIKLFPKIQFLSASVDIGPALKVIGGAMYLKSRSLDDSIIIVIDDDNVYGRSMVDTFAYFSLRYPNGAFTSTALQHITAFGFPPVLPISHPLLKSCYVLEGFAGYATRVQNIDAELIIALTRRDLNPLLTDCYQSDDVVISFVLAFKGIQFASTMVSNSPLFTGFQKKELNYYKDEYALHLRNSDETRSVQVINDSKYNSTIELLAKFALDWNSDGMKFLKRRKILKRIVNSYKIKNE